MASMFPLLFLFLSMVQISVQQCLPWTYNNPNKDWPKCWPTCDNTLHPLQSPVDIVNQVVDPLMGPAVFLFPDLDTVTLRHDDHTVSVVYPTGYTGGFSVNGMVYRLEEFHFHTPAENYLSILGEGEGQLDMEIHMVHKSYNSTNGTHTAILSLLWQKVDDYTHPWLNQILKNLSSISNQNQSLNIPLTDLSSLFNDQQKDFGYWTIEGSLTTPPCTGAVTWYIMQVPLKCSRAQWRQFHEFFSGGNGNGNARPVQRQILQARAFMPSKSTPPSLLIVGLVVSLVVVISVVLSGVALYWHSKKKGIDLARPTYERL